MKTAAADFRGNDGKGKIQTFYEAVMFDLPHFFCDKSD
jgi:hypothetical protein